MKDAFESFINVRQNKPAEYMAKFLDAQVCAAATSRTRSGGWRPALARKTGQGRPRQGTMEETRARLPSASQRAALRAASTWQAMSADVFDSKELTN